MNFGGLTPTDITREFYFNVGGAHGFMRWGIYIFMFTALFYLAYSVVQKVRKWRQGKGELRTDYPEKRIIAVFKYALMQAKIIKESYAGIMHASIFFGFIVLFIVTLIIVVQEDITGLFMHYHFIHGNFYLIWSLFADVFGLIVLAGLAMAIYRRYFVKPSRLDTKPTDTFALIMLLFIVLSGFFNEGMRIAMTDFPVFEKVASPVGYYLFAIPFSIFSKATLQVLHYGNWWLHMLAAFSAMALLTTDKLGHILNSTLNVYFGNLNNEKASTKYMVPIIDPAEFEVAESFGVMNVEEYTWKQLMDSDACTRCGRCQDNCPAYLTDKPLSPKKLVNDIKDNMDERIPQLMLAEDPASVETTPLIDGSVLQDEFWSCTNCGACMEACPVNIEHIPKMIDLRRYKVLMEGDAAPELLTSFQNMESNFNPYGFAFAERGDWATEAGIKTLAEDKDVEYLYFVGCAASYDKRSQKVALALCEIMKAAGIKIGILGGEEACCGDAAMRGGNEYLFHAMATQNLETFKTYGVKKIITSCPHGFNMLKKEYKAFSDVGLGSDGEKLSYDFEVFHHTEVIAELVKSGKIKLKEELNDTITYHDSCFLGRYNEIYSEPRDVIKAIPGTNFVEMSRNHENSFCCGAGGARMFIEEHIGTRVNQFRTKDAQASGAAKICTACPFCMTMLSDGALELDIQNLETYDLAELVANSMEK
ncbi:MAG: heterodisulfide reductase-related iron-sulfur binding cluster [Bacteroidales bacterium]|jgi:Fe-S oxidoreductase/nitrate reductase gamma subunit|nr:heterodisulfide reductase-related iron-sulfur binding cluster [Bacteroidales bacterium]